MTGFDREKFRSSSQWIILGYRIKMAGFFFNPKEIENTSPPPPIIQEQGLAML